MVRTNRPRVDVVTKFTFHSEGAEVVSLELDAVDGTVSIECVTDYKGKDRSSRITMSRDAWSALTEQFSGRGVVR